MMKRTRLLSFLFVLLVTLMLAGCGLSGQTGEKDAFQGAANTSEPGAAQESIDPSIPEETLNQSTQPEAAKISLDFTKQTNGRQVYEVDFGSGEPDAWKDQVYTDAIVINGDRILLVPQTGATELSGGWSEDHSVFVSPTENVQLYATGLEPGVLYRVALFVPQPEDNVNTSVGVYYSSAVCQEEGESTLVCTALISCYTGLYRDVTVVISGNDEIYIHTFDVQIQNVSQQQIGERERWVRNGLYFSSRYQNIYAPYVRKAGPVSMDSIVSSGSGISIVSPTDMDLYTGNDGSSRLECVIALDSGYDPEEEWEFEILYRFTEQATGEEIYSGTTYEYLQGSEEVFWLSPDIYVNMLEEKEYSLFIEVTRSRWDYQRGEYVDRATLGSDTVVFSVEKETIPSEIYAKYLGTDKLSFYLYSGENYYWNEDSTQLTFNSSARKFDFHLAGMEYDKIYRYALIQENDRSGKITVTPIPQTEDLYGYIGVDMTDILRIEDQPEKVTLLAYSGEKYIAHTFTASYYEYMETGAESGAQRDAGSGRDSFVWNSWQVETPPQPEKGYTVGIPEGTILSGYVGNELNVPIAFSQEYDVYETVYLSLTEKKTGKLIGEATIEVNTENAYEQPPCLVVTEDFDPGTYILAVSVSGKKTERQIVLEKERTPMEVYTEYKTKAGVIGELDEQGFTVYENPEDTIIPEVRTLLASMQSFDTDMFHQFLRYRYAENGGMIDSFALISPNVPESEQSIDREDLLFTANWLLRDIHMFQSGGMKKYTDAQIVDLDRLSMFFENDWKEMKAMDYAAGAAKDSDGTVYIWLPVYFEDQEGNLANNELYLFVYILSQGADTAYLDATGFYNPEFYNDYHTTQLLITDQNVVANMLNKLNRTRSVLLMPMDTNDYPYLYPDDTGEYVRRVQQRLLRLGYLTTSVDSVFTPSVEEAVDAWRMDMGLEEQYGITPEMQRLLHDSTPYRDLLVAWLNEHS